MMEYQTVVDASAPIYVPIEFRETIICGIDWKHTAGISLNKRGAGGLVDQKSREFYNQRRLANARYTPFSLAEAYEWNLQTARLVVKV